MSLIMASYEPEATEPEEPTLQLPVLLAKLGHSNGGAITATAAGFGLLWETNSSTTIPTETSGWTTVATPIYGSTIAARLSYKMVAVDEVVDPIGSSRANLRIYDKVDLENPVEVSDVFSGTDAANVPGLVIPEGGRMVLGFIRTAGSVSAPWASPIGEEIHSQSTSAIASSAQSDGLLETFSGVTLDVSNNDHAGVVLTLKGAPA